MDQAKRAAARSPVRRVGCRWRTVEYRFAARSGLGGMRAIGLQADRLRDCFSNRDGIHPVNCDRSHSEHFDGQIGGVNLARGERR